MKIQKSKLDRCLKCLILSLLLVGGLVRIVSYFQNRSLFMDEANLARNFVEKSFAELFQTLEYGQYSPPLFSCIEKMNLWCLGIHEYALRLFPLLAGVLMLILFYRLLTYFIQEPLIQWFPVFVISLSPFFIRYSTEVKQYSTDGMIALLLVILAIQEGKNLVEKPQFSQQQFWKWAIIGGLAIWWSMASVFVLAGIGIYFLSLSYFLSAPSFSTALVRFSGLFLVWLISFGSYFWLLLRQDIQQDHLQAYHQNWFPPFFPLSIEELKGWWMIFRSFLKTAIGYTGLAIFLGIVGLIAGGLFCIKMKNTKAILLFVPIISCWVAASFHFYSLIPRLILFLIPFLLIIIGIGLQWIFRQLPFWGKLILIGLLLMVASLQKGYEDFWKPYRVAAIKPLLKHLSQHYQKEDLLYVDNEAVAAFYFYAQLHQDYRQLPLPTAIIYAKWNEQPNADKLAIHQSSHRRVWLLYAHLMSKEAQDRLRREAKMMDFDAQLLEEITAEAACLRLYKID